MGNKGSRAFLLITATGKYIQFLEQLLESAEKFFLDDVRELQYVVFSNHRFTDLTNALIDKYPGRIKFVHVEHEPFPAATMNRYRFYENFLLESETDVLHINDYVFCIDVDAKFAAPITLDELMPQGPQLICAVTHCAYVKRPWTLDPDKINKETNCALDLSKCISNPVYYGGGFVGGTRNGFLQLCVLINKRLNADRSSATIPCWHDESALNSILNRLDFNPMVNTLPVDFHYPEHHQFGVLPFVKQWWDENKITVKPRIIFLDKRQGKIDGENLLRY